MSMRWILCCSSLVVPFVIGCHRDDGASSEGDTDFVATCDVPRMCDDILWQCLPLVEGSCDAQPYGPEFECAFAVLANAEPARVHLRFNGELTGEVDWIDVVVVGDGRGVYQYGIEEPGSNDHYFETAQRCTLQPASWFEACLAPDVTAEQHAACMDPYAWFADDCMETSMCP